MARRKWSKAKVIDAIREWHRKGVPAEKIWREDGALHAAGNNRFGSWRKAIVAAGLQPIHQQWSKERVLGELRTRHGNGLPRSFRCKDHQRLTSAAKRYFGSWHNALVAAGLRRGKSKIRRRWNGQVVIEAIRARHEQGLSLSSVWRDDESLYAVAKKWFGTWRQAVTAAGVTLPPVRQWTAKSVIEEIRSRHRQGLPLVGIERAAHTLYGAARRHYGGWREALREAGLESEIPYRSRSKQSVIDALLKRQARGLSSSKVLLEDGPLHKAACRKFGSWQNAIRAAGLTPKSRRQWSKPRVIKELRDWYGRSKLSVRLLDPSLAAAARRLFGSLNKALETAGLEPRFGHWTTQRVLEELQNQYVRGGCVDDLKSHSRVLTIAAKRLFGSWHHALRAAGISDKRKAK